MHEKNRSTDLEFGVFLDIVRSHSIQDKLGLVRNPDDMVSGCMCQQSAKHILISQFSIPLLFRLWSIFLSNVLESQDASLGKMDNTNLSTTVEILYPLRKIFTGGLPCNRRPFMITVNSM